MVTAIGKYSSYKQVNTTCSKRNATHGERFCAIFLFKFLPGGFITLIPDVAFFFFPVPVCAITASGVPGGTLVSMNRFSTLCG
jgi:hypothetical protein